MNSKTKQAMNDAHIIQAIGFAAPLFSALLSCGMCLAYYLNNSGNGRQKHILLMVFTFIAASLCWLAPLLLMVSPEMFTKLNPLFFFALMLDQVLLYNFVFIITGTDTSRRHFRVINYIIPLVLTATVTVWSLTVPYDVRLEIATGEGLIHPIYTAYSLVFFSSMPIFCIYNIFYTVLGFYRVSQYRRHITDFSADSQRTSLQWLYLFMTLVLSSIPLPLATLFLNKNTILGSQLAIASAMFPIIQYAVIVYNVISGNYVLITPVSETETAETVKPSKFNRKCFEEYMHERKPYINPDLRITDLVADLHTNRTYLSNFINTEYSMNFSRYINLQRLKELDKLRTMPPNAGYTNLELILMAGFSSYRSYLRVKEIEDKSKILKIFE